jgi:hypothetical protein
MSGTCDGETPVEHYKDAIRAALEDTREDSDV